MSTSVEPIGHIEVVEVISPAVRQVSFRMGQGPLARLEQLAREHERTLSGEIRRAIALYLTMVERQQAAPRP